MVPDIPAINNRHPIVRLNINILNTTAIHPIVFKNTKNVARNKINSFIFYLLNIVSKLYIRYITDETISAEINKVNAMPRTIAVLILLELNRCSIHTSNLHKITLNNP